MCCSTAYSSASMSLVPSPFTEEHRRGLPALPRSHCLSVPAQHKPGAPHPDTHPLLCCKEERFSRPCKADSHPTTPPPGPFGGFSTFCSSFSGQKGSPRPQRLFNTRGSFNSSSSTSVYCLFNAFLCTGINNSETYGLQGRGGVL